MRATSKLVLSCCKAKLYLGETCRCQSINIVKRTMVNYIFKLRSLSPVKIGKETISYISINSWVASEKRNNDSNNKQREAIIDGIINNKIPNEYFIKSNRWRSLKNAVDLFVSEVFPEMKDGESVECKHKGGRGYNYDFDFILNQEKTHIELKFNAANVDETPQFASPMKPSQYLSQSFEEYHYTHVLPEITKLCERLSIPDKERYMKEIHGNQPACMIDYQKLYYEGCKGSSKFTEDPIAIRFYQESREKAKKGIHDFIEETNLNNEKLSEYLLESQKGKIYMLFQNGKFHLQEVNLDDYKIEAVEKNPTKFRYECTTKTGITMNVLLRWKNGNGIAFPAFQISAQR